MKNLTKYGKPFSKNRLEIVKKIVEFLEKDNSTYGLLIVEMMNKIGIDSSEMNSSEIAKLLNVLHDVGTIVKIEIDDNTRYAGLNSPLFD